jgi:ATP-dependent Clp protease protease subunit
MKLKALQKAHDIALRHREATKRPLFEAKKEGDRAQLYIYEAIGQDFWTGEGVTAKRVRDALAGFADAKVLDVFINSPGGDIFEAKAIHSQLLRFAGEKVIHVDGIAASAATFIAMAGDKIITAATATWMIHEVSAIAFGRAEDMRAMADLLEKENCIYAETYAKRTGGKVDEILALMNAETWMNAEEAKASGFTDEIADAETQPEAAAAARNPVIAVAAQTSSVVELARQRQRLNQLSVRVSPASDASGSPRPTTTKS